MGFIKFVKQLFGFSKKEEKQDNVSPTSVTIATTFPPYADWVKVPALESVQPQKTVKKKSNAPKKKAAPKTSAPKPQPKKEVKKKK